MGDKDDSKRSKRHKMTTDDSTVVMDVIKSFVNGYFMRQAKDALKLARETNNMNSPEIQMTVRLILAIAQELEKFKERVKPSSSSRE